MRPEGPKKRFFEAGPPLIWGSGWPPPPPYLKVWIRHYTGPSLLPCLFEKPVILVGIQMKGLISTEKFQKIVISYEVLSFSACFWRNDRNSFYHLCGLTVSQKSQNYTANVICNTAFSITWWIPWVDFCNRSVKVQMLVSRRSFLLMFFSSRWLLRIPIGSRSGSPSAKKSRRNTLSSIDHKLTNNNKGNGNMQKPSLY